MGQIKLLVPHWVCEFDDCNHVWPARFANPPAHCPACKRMNWFYEKVRSRSVPRVPPYEVIVRTQLQHSKRCHCMICQIKRAQPMPQPNPNPKKKPARAAS